MNRYSEFLWFYTRESEKTKCIKIDFVVDLNSYATDTSNPFCEFAYLETYALQVFLCDDQWSF